MFGQCADGSCENYTLATSDFGEIVYNLIRIGKMSKSAGDRREDFDEVYDFEQALVQEYRITHED